MKDIFLNSLIFIHYNTSVLDVNFNSVKRVLFILARLVRVVPIWL